MAERGFLPTRKPNPKVQGDKDKCWQNTTGPVELQCPNCGAEWPVWGPEPDGYDVCRSCLSRRLDLSSIGV